MDLSPLTVDFLHIRTLSNQTSCIVRGLLQINKERMIFMLSAGALLILFLVGLSLRKNEQKNVQTAGIFLQAGVVIFFLIQTAIKLGYLPL